MKEAEYLDQIILALRAKYQQKRSEDEPLGEAVQIGVSRVPLNKEMLFGGRCSMLLPVNLKDMDYFHRTVKYQNQKRPEIIKTDAFGDASITFSILPAFDTGEKDDIFSILKQQQSDMKKIWKQNVYYDIDEITVGKLPVAWMDFRAFCLNGSLYCMIFLFYIEEQMVLGNFHCSFPLYDVWKPVVLKLLTTIETHE